MTVVSVGSRSSDAAGFPDWRQGSLTADTDAQRLLSAAVDLCPRPAAGKRRFVAVAVSHDCDLAADERREPHAEFVAGCEIDGDRPEYRHGRNPRVLHVAIADDRWIEISIHDRFRVSKSGLKQARVDPTASVKDADLEVLTSWIAKRYTRAAFPDAFNDRLKRVDKPLEKLFKSGKGRAVTAIYLNCAERELSEAEKYRVAIRILAPAQVWEDSRAKDEVQNFESEFVRILNGCTGIAVEDALSMPESDFSYADLRKYKRLDRDYRSFSDDGDTARPVDSGAAP